MPIFTASSGSISGGIAFLSHLFACNNTSQSHQSSLSVFTNPHAVLNFPCFSRCSSAKRATFLAPKDTVSSGTDRTDGVAEILSSDDARPARRSADWKAARVYKERGLIFEGKVEGFNGGGLLIRFYSLLGFLPYPQLSPSHSCKEQQKPIQEVARALIGSIIPMKDEARSNGGKQMRETSILVDVSFSKTISEVIQADEENRKLIFSEKEAAWSKFSQQITVGDVFHAKVGTVEDYGAFVHLRFPDGYYHLTGLVHVSEVSWDLVQDVRDVLTEGDEVRVKIINVDREKCRITLSIKQLEEDPVLETLEKVIPLDASASLANLDDGYKIEALPGLEAIFEELLQEDGINDVKISRQGFEKRVVSQDLQLWLSNIPPTGNQFTLLARAGRQVQEIQLFTSLDQEGIKRALQRVLERVP